MEPELDPDLLIALNRLTIVARTVAGTAHDVNNALQIIGGSADLVAQQPGAIDPTQRALHRIRTQTNRAAESLRVLTDFARGGDPPDTLVSVRQVMTQALALRGHAHRRARLTVAFDPARAPEGIVRGQHSQLLQAVLNLLMNAEQAMNGVPGEIVLALAPARGAVSLTITDTGGGIPAEMIERLFVPFHTSWRSHESAGLGLAATRVIARRHGGDVTVQTGTSGTTATLTLPTA